MHYKVLHAISLPGILGKAGYWRAAFTSADPGFDNILSTLRDWFDFYEYNPDDKKDVALANRLAEYLSKVDRDKPLYVTWMSSASHFPFNVPNGNGKKGYDEVLHYADSAIGMVLDAIENYRRNEAIVIITGDHSYPEVLSNATNIQGIHSGYTHMPLFIQTPNTQNGGVMNKIVSQIDIAPTILNELNLSVSNNFPGHNLFSDTSYPILAFRNWECAIYNYESQECEEAMKSWAWILNNNKLMQPP
jgi:phosphoglycerol transferase MdoB-like AlkP superfamily enzyme